MSLRDCIDSAVQQGQLTKEEGDELKKRYDRLARTILDKTRIKGALLSELEEEAAERQRRALLTEMARRSLVEQMEAYRDARGNRDLGRAVRSFVENLGERSRDVQTSRDAIIAGVHSKLATMLHEFRKGLITGHMRRDGGEVKVRMDNVVRELFGEKTGDEVAAGYAKIVDQIFEDLRVRYNDAGGGIRKLKSWGLPQSHNRLALIDQGKETWVKFLMEDGRLDRERMVHPLTGRRLSDDELREALEVSYDRITTEGWIDREPSGVPYGKGALWKQHQDHRFIHFKNADKWLEYQKEYGGVADPWDSIVGHIYTMAGDIASMEVFGPNPAVLREYIKQYAIKQIQTEGGDIDRLMTDLKMADTDWATYRGQHNSPVNAFWANTMQAARNVVTATSLGSAVLSAFSDLASQKVARAFLGASATDRSTLLMLKEVMSQHGTDRDLAVRSGLILDEAIHGSHQQARYAGTLNGRSITGFLADRTIALQGLSSWTQRAKHAFGLWLQGHVSDHVGTGWADLPDPVRRMFDRHGVTETDWDLMRRASVYEPKPGARFLRPNEIAEHVADMARASGLSDERAAAQGRSLAEKYIRLILRETRFAVPEATLRSTSIVTGGARSGTVPGELTRSFAQFKGFAIVMMMLHGRRLADELIAGRFTSAAHYAGAFLITGTLLGAVSMGLKDIASGRDVRKWQDEKTYKTAEFWGAAILQAGGLGIFGDFLFSDLNRFGGGLSSTLAGPLFGRMTEVINLTLGNSVEGLKQALGDDKPTHAGRELVRFLKANAPLVSSLWYVKLAYQRILESQLQTMMDRDAASAFRREINKRARDYHQGYFWRPGQATPDRWPEFSPLR